MIAQIIHFPRKGTIHISGFSGLLLGFQVGRWAWGGGGRDDWANGRSTFPAPSRLIVMYIYLFIGLIEGSPLVGSACFFPGSFSVFVG